MYAVTSTWLVSLTRATFRSAEFGFFGVVVYTRVHTPRRCGLPLRAAVFTFAILSRRPLRTSCWMVGIYRLSLFVSSCCRKSLYCCYAPVAYPAAGSVARARTGILAIHFRCFTNMRIGPARGNRLPARHGRPRYQGRARGSKPVTGPL